MNRLVEKYHGKVTFVFIYAREAHPPGWTAFFRPEEDITGVSPEDAAGAYLSRQKAGRSLCLRMGKSWHVLIDDFGQMGARHAYVTGYDNALFVVGADGNVIRNMEWTDAVELDGCLARLVVLNETGQGL